MAAVNVIVTVLQCALSSLCKDFCLLYANQHLPGCHSRCMPLHSWTTQPSMSLSGVNAISVAGNDWITCNPVIQHQDPFLKCSPSSAWPSEAHKHLSNSTAFGGCLCIPKLSQKETRWALLICFSSWARSACQDFGLLRWRSKSLSSYLNAVSEVFNANINEKERKKELTGLNTAIIYLPVSLCQWVRWSYMGSSEDSHYPSSFFSSEGKKCF